MSPTHGSMAKTACTLWKPLPSLLAVMAYLPLLLCSVLPSPCRLHFWRMCAFDEVPMSFLELSEGLQGLFTGQRMIDHGEGIVPPEDDAGTGQRQFAGIGGVMDIGVIKSTQFR